MQKPSRAAKRFTEHDRIAVDRSESVKFFDGVLDFPTVAFDLGHDDVTRVNSFATM
jgi:hypothetical protein